MDRILRILPPALMVVLAALAAGSIRWATDRPVSPALSETTPQSAVAPADVPDGATAARGCLIESRSGGRLPQLLATEESARRLLPVERPSQLVLSTGFPAEETAAEAAHASGPELTEPAEPLERLPSAGKAPAEASGESLSEMPIAETSEPAVSSQICTAIRGRMPRLPGDAEESAFPAETSTAIRGRMPRLQAEAPGPMISPLTIAEPNQSRSEQLEQVARQADRQTRHGFDLAGRGAYFAARSEFIGVLRLVAEGLDTEQQSTVHGRALAAAMLAMREAEDFLPGGSRLEADLDLSEIIASHSTPVLKDGAEHVTPLTALKCYFTFAQEQFSAAAGGEIAGSMALHALGKLHNTLAQKKGIPIVAPEAKAMAFYQAALLVSPKNYLAANDLGVLLAQYGNYAEARVMLEHSLSLCRQSTGWRNLAAVYRELGQTALAARANRQATLLRQAELARRQASSTAASGDAVRWVDSQTFVQTSANGLTSPGTPPPATNAAGPPAATEKCGVGGATRDTRRARRVPALDHARGEANVLGTIGVLKLRSYRHEIQSPQPQRFHFGTCHPETVRRAVVCVHGVGGITGGVLARGLGDSGTGRSNGRGHSGGASPCRRDVGARCLHYPGGAT